MKNLIFLLFGLLFFACNNTSTKSDTLSEKVFSQQEMQDLLLPVLKTEGKLYSKYKITLARKAFVGEKIETITADGKETSNIAQRGDMVVKNTTGAGEMYILSKEKFDQKYSFIKNREDGYSEYTPKGKAIVAEMTPELLQRLNFPKEFKFTAAWGEDMVVKENDFLVCPPDYSEIYRIANKEFFETYREVKKVGTLAF